MENTNAITQIAAITAKTTLGELLAMMELGSFSETASLFKKMILVAPLYGCRTARALPTTLIS